jgi:carbamoyl-phosphate synthase large subunit
MRILISSAGRRVGLIRCFRESFDRLNQAGTILAADSCASAPALDFADRSYIVPLCGEPGFLRRIAEICRLEQVDLVIPTIDPELPVYARSAELLGRTGTALCLSSRETVELCGDKQLTNRWLRSRDFPATRQVNLSEFLRAGCGWNFPVVVKPRHGSGSLGIRRVSCEQELAALAEAQQRTVEYVVEQIAPGEEYTINAFVDEHGVCRAAVPHRRIEVRGGEVSKAATVKDRRLIGMGREIAEALPGAHGPLSIQCFLEPGGAIHVTEINPRFGGGYPLTHRAGARFTDWLLQQRAGLPVGPCDEWEAGLTMLRYDGEVFRQALGASASLQAISGVSVPPRSPHPDLLLETVER